ncbi:BOI-related E3 ubiquitin-protein ligase 1-like isoform X1 [Zingiber officinale]|uniref:BOI-related E3 ubiquitin-protein ligase 1-like isoform X1 n=1 Tax=Zingiber officinale TaxID=94328 RepID=UPI001C4C8B51|nr:BOI-related E3 ubiquitin-protein ligase 1-like isoform X1 [Zingiber officinale]
MAVHAVGFSSDFGNRGVDELQMPQQDPGNLLRRGGILGIDDAGKQQQPPQEFWIDPTMLGEWRSDLGCNASVCGNLEPSGRNHVTTSPVFPFPSADTSSVKAPGAVPGVLPHSRLPKSGTTSTSGRHALPLPPVSSSARDIVAVLFQQNQEINAFLCFQNERMQNELVEMLDRHSRTVQSVLRQQVAKRLMEKEAELLSLKHRNEELEEKVRQITEENQFWFNMAKNSEVIVRNLQSSLEQTLHHGDLNNRVVMFPADDAHSCCYEEDCTAAAPAAGAGSAKLCTTCGATDVCILSLPCRHLCLCKDCASRAAACPVCGATVNNFLEVFVCR